MAVNSENRYNEELYRLYEEADLVTTFNTLRTGAFKLFKCTFPGSKQFKSTFIMCFFKYL